MMLRQCRLLLLAAAAMLAACGPEAPDSLEAPLEVSAPLQSSDGLVYVHRTFEQVQRLRPTGSGSEVELHVDRAPTGADPGAAALSADGQTLFVVHEGDQTLGAYDLSEAALSRQTIALDSVYDRITVDPEGDFVLLSFTGQRDDYVALNLNELGIVDLRDGLSDDEEATFVTLSSHARELIFTPGFELGGQPQRLAVALADSEVTLVDLLADNPDDRLREVRLTASQADQVRTPVQAIIDTTPDEATPNTAHLYLMTNVGQDITQVAIQPSVREDGLKFDLSVNQLAAGSSPRRMALLELGDGHSRLLVIDRTQPEFTLIDTHSGESATFELPMTRPADDLLVYRTTNEADEPTTRVLVWSTGSPLAAVIRPENIAIANDTPTLGRSVEAIRLKQPPSRVVMDDSADTERAVVYHGGLSAGLTVLDLRRNRPVPIEGESLQDISFSGPVAYGVFANSPHMATFQLDTGHPTVFELPRPGERIFVDEDKGLVIVQHDSQTGSFTVLDAQQPTQSNARLFDGVFVDHLFDQELP